MVKKWRKTPDELNQEEMAATIGDFITSALLYIEEGKPIHHVKIVNQNLEKQSLGEPIISYKSPKNLLEKLINKFSSLSEEEKNLILSNKESIDEASDYLEKKLELMVAIKIVALKLYHTNKNEKYSPNLPNSEDKLEDAFQNFNVRINFADFEEAYDRTSKSLSIVDELRPIGIDVSYFINNVENIKKVYEDTKLSELIESQEPIRGENLNQLLKKSQELTAQSNRLIESKVQIDLNNNKESNESRDAKKTIGVLFMILESFLVNYDEQEENEKPKKEDRLTFLDDKLKLAKFVVDNHPDRKKAQKIFESVTGDIIERDRSKPKLEQPKRSPLSKAYKKLFSPEKTR